MERIRDRYLELSGEDMGLTVKATPDAVPGFESAGILRFDVLVVFLCTSVTLE